MATKACISVISEEYAGYFAAYKKFRSDYPDFQLIANEYRADPFSRFV